MSKTLLIIFTCVSCVIAGWSLYRVERSQEQIEVLTTAVDGVERNVSRRSDRSQASVDRLLVPRIDVAAVARTAARNETLAMLEEKPDEDGAEGAALEQLPTPTFEDSRESVLSAYVDEPPDPNWSTLAANELDDLVRRNLIDGSRVDALECRSTMCRIDLTHPDANAHTAFVMDGLHDWPGSIFVAEENNKGSEYVVTLYVAREGFELPLGPY